jgi:hypothetical protein
MRRHHEIEDEIASIDWASQPADRVNRGVYWNNPVSGGMFPGAFLQYPGVVFSGLDSLRPSWHTADRRRPDSTCAHEVRTGAFAADPDLSMSGCVLHVLDLVAVLQLN